MEMRKLRMGMVGGGEGAFIGAIHRTAALMDGQIELVCGAFSSDAQRSLESGKKLGLTSNRCYASYDDLFKLEAALPADQRMDFVSIVTPNHLHFPVAKAALEAGFNVISDKPATFSLKEALELKELVESSELVYALTHTYTGYPLVKEARDLVARKKLGAIKKIVVEYSQGWLTDLDTKGNKQAAWRLNPQTSGVSCCMGDIGVHAANLAEYICEDEITDVCSLLDSADTSRLLDDDGTVLFKTAKGASGVLLASQISVGEENNLRIRVYGETASLDWHQHEPNTLWFRPLDDSAVMIRTGVGSLSEQATAATRTPAGHPEGYLEAFANLYQSFVAQVRLNIDQTPLPAGVERAPSIADGVRGMAFIESVVSANKSDRKWHPIKLHID
ncbi:Gfo/Idh/MocA family oxidoreductase [Arenicella sp. 4NH20-0111]|uniref:Gfo/Idh/MocA family protein n=1 Tax=Arenicella sp. 4NH20-0111 TaxID=3127648 RepID=UPI00333EFABB